LWTIVLGVLFLPLLLAPRRWMMICGTSWSAGTLALLKWIVGLDHQVSGRHHLPAGPAIIAMKHQSAWDTFAGPVIFPDSAMVIKRELGWIPFYGWYALKAGMIGVDRSAGAKAMRRMLSAAERALATGRFILIFPEGTRTVPGADPTYQPGVAALYRHLGVPVVPVAVNSGVFWGRREFAKRPGTIIVDILPPIPPGLPKQAFMQTLENAIETASRRLLGPCEARRERAH
jgi:1-acyl-sn-glycerol-3-phosphate acyltransferase